MAKSSKVSRSSASKGPATKARVKPPKAAALKAPKAAPARSISASALAELGADEQRALQQALGGKATLLHGSPRARDAHLFVAAARVAQRPVLVASPRAAELFEAAHAMAGVDVVSVASFFSHGARAAAKKRLLRGGSLLVIAEPAQLLEQELWATVAKAPLSLLGIAAAHACSEHAHELSPAYLGLREAQRALSAPVLATSTQTNELVIEQICQAIGAARRGVIHQAEPALQRQAQVMRASERKAKLLSSIVAFGLPGVVLAATPQEVDAVFGELEARGVSAVRAHSGMTPGERSAALVRFGSPRERLVLVTQSPHGSASGLAGCSEANLGLGSKPPRDDLAFVIHYQAPLSPEQHFEDLSWLPAGAHSLLLADSSDAALVQALLAQQRIKPAAIEAMAEVLAQSAADRPAFSDTLALRAGTSRRSAERVLSALWDRGLIVRDNGQITRTASPERLAAEARLLAKSFATLRAADAERAQVVARYVTSRHERDTAPARSDAGVAVMA